MNKKIHEQVLKEVLEYFKTGKEIYHKDVQKVSEKAISRTIELKDEENKRFNIKYDDIQECNYCGNVLALNKHKHWVRKNITSKAEAMMKSVLCDNCINAGLDAIDEIDFDVSEGDDKERKRIFEEIVISKVNKQKADFRKMIEEFKKQYVRTDVTNYSEGYSNGWIAFGNQILAKLGDVQEDKK